MVYLTIPMCYNKAAATVWAAPLHDTERTDLPMPSYHITCSILGCNKPTHARGWCHPHYENWRRTGDPIPCHQSLYSAWWDRVDFAVSGCWNWTGATAERGYGLVYNPQTKRFVRAHRRVYEMCVGPIPDGLEIDHLCRNPRCINPDHLEPVTHVENCLRSPIMGQGQTTKTHCPAGHPYEGENLYIFPNGARACRTCQRVHQAAWYLRRKQGESWGLSNTQSETQT